jgi:prolyl-tRNA synthetase
VDVLLDDRAGRPGVKFADAELIGIPLRVTIGPRGLENSIVELTARTDGERHDVPVDDVVARLVDLVVTGRSAGR